MKLCLSEKKLKTPSLEKSFYFERKLVFSILSVPMERCLLQLTDDFIKKDSYRKISNKQKTIQNERETNGKTN